MRPAGHPALVQRAQQVIRLHGGRPHADQVVELGHVGAAGAVGGVPLVVGELRASHHRGQPPEHRVLVGGDEDQLAVAGRVDVARRDVRQHAARPLPLVAGQGPLGEQRFHQAEHGFVDGGIHHLPAAGALARVQRHHRAEGRERRGQRVTERHAGPRRRPVGVAGDVPDTAHRLADGAESGPRRVRPGLAEPGHPGDDQAGVDLPEPFRGEAPALQRARPEVLQQHVGPGREAADQILAPGITQVDR